MRIKQSSSLLPSVQRGRLNDTTLMGNQSMHMMGRPSPQPCWLLESINLLLEPKKKGAARPLLRHRSLL